MTEQASLFFYKAYARVLLAIEALRSLPEHARVQYVDPLTREVVRCKLCLLRPRNFLPSNVSHRKPPRTRTATRPPSAGDSSSLRFCCTRRTSCSLPGATANTTMSPTSSRTLYRLFRQIRRPCNGLAEKWTGIAGGTRLACFQPRTTLRLRHRVRQRRRRALGPCRRLQRKHMRRRRSWGTHRLPCTTTSNP